MRVSARAVPVAVTVAALGGCSLETAGGRLGLLVVLPLALGLGLWWLVRRPGRRGRTTQDRRRPDAGD